MTRSSKLALYKSCNNNNNKILAWLLHLMSKYNTPGTFYQVQALHRQGEQHNHSQNLHCLLNHWAKSTAFLCGLKMLDRVAGFVFFLWTESIIKYMVISSCLTLLDHYNIHRHITCNTQQAQLSQTLYHYYYFDNNKYNMAKNLNMPAALYHCNITNVHCVHIKRCHWFLCCNFYIYRRIFIIFLVQLCKRMPKYLV